MNDHKCRFCVGDFLRGEERCSRCGATLESPIREDDRPAARSASEVFTPQHEILDSDRSHGRDRDDHDLDSLLFDWKNPIVLNLVGSLVCTMILIATVLELL